MPNFSGAYFLAVQSFFSLCTYRISNLEVVNAFKKYLIQIT